jgi:hypothetical protein
MRMGRQRREGPAAGAWVEDMEQAGRAGVGCRRHHLSQGLDPGHPAGRRRTASLAMAPWPDSRALGAASPEVNRNEILTKRSKQILR